MLIFRGVKPHEFGPVERTPATYLHHLMFISLNWSLTAFLARWISMFSWHQRKVVPTSKSYLYSFFFSKVSDLNETRPFLQEKLWSLRVLKGFPIHKCHRKIKTNPSSKNSTPLTSEASPNYRGANTWELVALVVKLLDHWLPEDEMDSGFGWQDWSKLFFNIFFWNVIVIGKILWESTFRNSSKKWIWAWRFSDKTHHFVEDFLSFCQPSQANRSFDTKNTWKHLPGHLVGFFYNMILTMCYECHVLRISNG